MESWLQKMLASQGSKLSLNRIHYSCNFSRQPKPLKLAESTYDKLWGMGLSLNDANALKPSHWANQGLLGEILMEIRDNADTAPL